MDCDEVMLGAACHALIANEHGIDQPTRTKHRLRDLEALGLAKYESRGWRLTDTGERLARKTITEARRRARGGQ